MKDLEPGPDLELGLTEIDNHLTTFFLQEAEQIKAETNSIRQTLTQLQTSNNEALKSQRTHVNADILSVSNRARAIRAKLEQMEKSNAAVTKGLRKILKEVMMEFQELRQGMMAEYKETVGRRYFTVTEEFPDEEVIEEIIAGGADEFLSRAIHVLIKKRSLFLAGALQEEHWWEKVAETVAEIQERHDAAKEIEKSLLELQEIFLGMVVMVETQDDDIEHHVMSTAAIDGTKNLSIAKQHYKSSRKCCLCIGILLMLLLLLVVFFIGGNILLQVVRSSFL